MKAGATTPLTLLGSGKVGIGTITPSTKLDVSGSITISETTGQLLLPYSSVAATPTLAFGDGDTGFYESSDDVIRISNAGTGRYEFSASQFRGIGAFALLYTTPTSTTPTIAPYHSDTNTGIG